jgi:hypothetical protein
MCEGRVPEAWILVERVCVRIRSNQVWCCALERGLSSVEGRPNDDPRRLENSNAARQGLHRRDGRARPRKVTALNRAAIEQLYARLAVIRAVIVRVRDELRDVRRRSESSIV